jgi:predicted transcriptional regulator YdeE
MAKSKRLIDLMIKLNSKKRYTVQELADEFGVSYRTMWRYLQELSAMGMSLYSESGIYGGYQVLNEKKIPLIQAKHHKEVEGKIIERPSIRVAGFEFTAPYTAFSEVEVLAPRLWLELLRRRAEIPYVNSNIRLGLAQNRTDDFTYYVTLEVEHFENIPDDFIQMHIPSRTYALFTHYGSLDREHVHSTYYSIYKWLDRNRYEQDKEALNIEHFDERFQPNSRNNQYDIYIPIKSETDH